VSGQQHRPGEPPERRPVSDLPFFAPPRGEFDPGAGGFAAGPGAGPVARFGAPASPVPDARFGGGYGGPVPQGFRGAAQPVAHRVVGLEAVAGLGQAAVVLSVVVAAADVVCAAGLLLGDSLAGWVALLVGGVGFYGGLLAALVVTALWLGRARRNAQRITPAVPHRRAAVWAWFGWFTPIAWFFVPRQLVEDVWTASRRRAPRGVEAPLRLWWTAWILAGLAGGMSLRLADTASDGVLTGLGVLEALCYVAGVPLFRSVVHAVNSAQRPDAGSR
jgi:hypothetical protein